MSIRKDSRTNKFSPNSSFFLGGILPYLLTRSWKFTVENEYSILLREGMTAAVDTPQGVVSPRGMVQTGDVPAARTMIPLHYETYFAFLPSPEIIAIC